VGDPAAQFVVLDRHEAVRSGQCLPLCKQCAVRFAGPETKRVGRLVDRRRTAGPHDQGVTRG
jgi:hypothetical protein